MESLIIAAVIAAAFWWWINRRRPGLFAPAVRPRPVVAEARTMPRLGKAGTITEEQIDALQANRFEPSGEWSFEEAALVLDAVDYLRAVCDAELGWAEPDIDLQNALLAFILTEDDLRDHVRKWGNGRRRGAADDAPPRNHQYDRVAERARTLQGDDA